MRSDEIEAAMRQTAFIGEATENTAYSSAVCLNELNDKLQTSFEDIVVKARAGYWLHDFYYTTIANDSRYRIPPRAVVGGLEKVEWASSIAGPFTKLSEVPASVAQDFRNTVTQDPAIYTVQGDIVDLIPTPNAGTIIRMAYYIRPSRLMTSQCSTLGGSFVDRGRITVINTGARTLTVNAVPFDYSLAVPAAITTAVQSIDVVHPDGWHELSLVGATQTLSGSVFTVGGTDSMADIQVGDYVRVADQTDWPCLPDDFHRCLSDAAAVKICLELGMEKKSESIALDNGNSLARFRSLLVPRVKAEPKTIPIMPKSRGRGWSPGWRLG